MNRFSQYNLPAYPRKKAKKKSAFKRKLLVWLIAVLLLAVVLFIYFQRNVTRVLISIS